MNVRSAKTRKVPLIAKFLIGMAVGAAGGALFMHFVGESRIDPGDPGAILAGTVGLIYALIGLMAGAGVLAPRQGALFLNVEDEVELREQRASLGPSAIACILIGLFLIVLALAPGGGPGGEESGRALWAAIALACVAGATIISVATQGRADELMRHVSREASALAMYATVLALGVWATLSHLGYVGWLTPLAAIATLALLQLLAIFWVGARRGLMKER